MIRLALFVAVNWSFNASSREQRFDAVRCRHADKELGLDAGPSSLWCPVFLQLALAAAARAESLLRVG